MAKKKKEQRLRITMACTECKSRNYNTTKNRLKNSGRIEFRKYCKFDKKHTLHRETR